MEKMFSSIMTGFMKGMSENDREKMTACGEMMSVMCPCLSMKDMYEEDKKAMKEKMMSFCGSKMEAMSSFFKKKGSQPEPTGQKEKTGQQCC
jgi:hypothetical protein